MKIFLLATFVCCVNICTGCMSQGINSGHPNSVPVKDERNDSSQSESENRASDSKIPVGDKNPIPKEGNERAESGHYTIGEKIVNGLQFDSKQEHEIPNGQEFESKQEFLFGCLGPICLGGVYVDQNITQLVLRIENYGYIQVFYVNVANYVSY